MQQNWQETPLSLATTLEQTLYIIDDALCYGFEFKVENHTIYFHEIGD